MDPRDALIERLADNIDPAHNGWSRELCEALAEAALSVVETATSTCPECGGKGSVTTNDVPGYDYGGPPWTKPCPSCGGQPGPLLILQVLGGEDFATRPISALNNGESFWRFPRRQEDQ